MSKPENDKSHIRHCMLFCFDLGKNASAATRLINQIYGEVMNPNKCQNWYRKFKSGNRYLEDELKTGRTSYFDNALLKSIVESDPNQSISELSDKLGNSRSTIHTHLKRIGKIYVKTPQDRIFTNKSPTNFKRTRKVKGSAITTRSKAIEQSKKKNNEEGQKIKKIVPKNVNEKMEEEMRAIAFDKKTSFSKAQQSVIAHNSKPTK